MSGCRPRCGSSDHHVCSGESDRLLEAFHDFRYQHPVPETKRHQSRSVLLLKPVVSRHLDVRAVSLHWGQLRSFCHCQVGAGVIHVITIVEVIVCFSLSCCVSTKWGLRVYVLSVTLKGSKLSSSSLSVRIWCVVCVLVKLKCIYYWLMSDS